jgi:hypothetical protein
MDLRSIALYLFGGINGLLCRPGRGARLPTCGALHWGAFPCRAARHAGLSPLPGPDGHPLPFRRPVTRRFSGAPVSGGAVRLLAPFSPSPCRSPPILRTSGSSSTWRSPFSVMPCSGSARSSARCSPAGKGLLDLQPGLPGGYFFSASMVSGDLGVLRPGLLALDAEGASGPRFSGSSTASTSTALKGPWTNVPGGSLVWGDAFTYLGAVS